MHVDTFGLEDLGHERADLGLLRGRSRSSASTTVTLTPNRLNTSASSLPIAPRPRT